MLREAIASKIFASVLLVIKLSVDSQAFHLLVLKWISVVSVRFFFCFLFVTAVLIVSSIIHRPNEYINRTVTVHAITSTSSVYVVGNTEIIKEQKDVYMNI